MRAPTLEQVETNSLRKFGASWIAWPPSEEAKQLLERARAPTGRAVKDFQPGENDDMEEGSQTGDEFTA